MNTGRSGFGMAILLVCAAVPVAAAYAADKKTPPAPQIVVDESWMAEIPNDGPTYGYFRIENRTEEPRLITGFQSPDCSSLKLEEAHSGMSNGRAAVTMTLAPKTTLVFSRGGYHLVCDHQQKPFTLGQKIPVTIALDGGKIGPLDFEFRNFPSSK